MSFTGHQPQRLGHLDSYVSASDGTLKWGAGWEGLRGDAHSCHGDGQETRGSELCDSVSSVFVPLPVEDLWAGR